jgi:hypothetical protein
MFGGLELGVKLWEGTFEGITRLWLRWCDADGNILLTGNERAAALAAKLRELGVDPASI